MDALLHFLGILVMCVTGLIALTLVLIVIVCCLPDNPLKHILKAIAKRLGATTLLMLIAVPVESIPMVDVLYDVGSLIFLAIYWYDIFKAIRVAFQPALPPLQPYSPQAPAGAHPATALKSMLSHRR